MGEDGTPTTGLPLALLPGLVGADPLSKQFALVHRATACLCAREPGAQRRAKLQNHVAQVRMRLIAVPGSGLGRKAVLQAARSSRVA